MTATGLLTVRANLHDGAVDELSVELRRPAVSQLFIGQVPEAVVKTMPYLYTLCAHAQRAAAQAALAAAAGDERRPLDNVALWVELLHENLWRLLLDWPAALGLLPAKAAFIAWRGERLGDNCVAETEKLLSGALGEAVEKCREKLVDRSNQTIEAMPDISLAPADWLAYWQGGAQPLAQPPSSIVAAFESRLAATIAAARALAAGAAYPVAAAADANGRGVGQTLTARGVLTHAAHLVDGKVSHYRVWAPTDIFFADAAALSALLAGRHFSSLIEARLGLEQAILALDPCLPYVVEQNNA